MCGVWGCITCVEIQDLVLSLMSTIDHHAYQDMCTLWFKCRTVVSHWLGACKLCLIISIYLYLNILSCRLLQYDICLFLRYDNISQILQNDDIFLSLKRSLIFLCLYNMMIFLWIYNVIFICFYNMIFLYLYNIMIFLCLYNMIFLCFLQYE